MIASFIILSINTIVKEYYIDDRTIPYEEYKQMQEEYKQLQESYKQLQDGYRELQTDHSQAVEYIEQLEYEMEAE
jgi:peptidoglycan hydrolase CwlO-like protein